MCSASVNAPAITEHELDRLELTRLAEAMGDSSRQLEEFCRVKAHATFRVCRELFLWAEQFAGCNLYAYVDTRKLARDLGAPGEDAADDSPSKTNQEQHSQDARKATHRRETEVERLVAQNEIKFGARRPARKRTMLARAYLVLYVTSVLLLARSIFTQYKYDFYHYHLLRIREALARGGPSGRSTLEAYASHQQDERTILDQRAQARAESTRTGSFLLDQGFFAECCYTLMILLSLFIYLGPILYYRFVKGEYDFYFVRMLLDWDQEQANCNLMIQRSVESVVKSSELFTQISLAQLRTLTPASTTSGRCAAQRDTRWPPLRSSRAKFAGVFERPIRRTLEEFLSGRRLEGWTRVQLEELFVREHVDLERQLKLYALEGRLQPLDRCEFNQFVHSLLMLLVYILTTCPGCFIWNIWLFSNLPRLFKFTYETSTWASLASMLWLACQNIALTYAGVYYFSTCLVFCRNQVLIVDKLRAMINELLRQNHSFVMAGCRAGGGAGGGDRNVGKSASAPTSGQEIPHDSLDSQLLLLIMHYKIFVRQLRHTKSTFNYLLMAAFGLMFIFPLLARLHSPYLTGDAAKTLVVVVCLIMVGLPDVAIFPIAWYNARSSSLYRDLASLLAHLVATCGDHYARPRTHHQKSQQPPSASPYNEHTLWLLRRELSHPENFRHQFAISGFGLEFSYNVLLKIHFWLGLLILTFVVDFQAPALGGAAVAATGLPESAAFSRWLADPLGIASAYETPPQVGVS